MAKKRKKGLVNDECLSKRRFGGFYYPCEKSKGHRGKHWYLICDFLKWDNKGNRWFDNHKLSKGV